MTKRDCVFFVADKTMRETFLGFLTRQDRDGQLGCGPFGFSALEDLFFAAGQNDPGLYTRAGALLAPVRHTHHKAVVALDCHWDASPGQAQIVKTVTGQLMVEGWRAEDVMVIAIDPELEQWIWQDSPVVATELRLAAPDGLKAALHVRGLWPVQAAKPPAPKDLFNQLRRENNVKMSASVYRRIAASVPVAMCQDREFQRLATQLRAWFPPGDVA